MAKMTISDLDISVSDLTKEETELVHGGRANISPIVPPLTGTIVPPLGITVPPLTGTIVPPLGITVPPL